MPKRISPADLTPIRVVLVTLDGHAAGAAQRARSFLKRDLPGLDFAFHSAADWDRDPTTLQRCIADIEQGDIIIATMLFTDGHIRAILPTLQARRDSCDAMVCAMSAGEVVKLTRMGGFKMDGTQSGPLALLKRLRGKSGGKDAKPGSSGAGQMAMLRRLPRILRFIPGSAQDVRAYFLTLQYWLAGSEQNIANLVRLLVDRYADGPRRGLRGQLKVKPPVEYPDVGIYHPTLPKLISEDARDLPTRVKPAGTVGLLIMRSYVLAGDTGHYDGVIRGLEAEGLRVIPAFASGLDARPAIDRFFINPDGSAGVDALVSLTGFSLVGGPAYNDSPAAEEVLARLDVPYVAAHALEFQTLEQWKSDHRGLSPVESTIMVAIPELDGATGPTVYGGRSSSGSGHCEGCAHHCTFPKGSSGRDMIACEERTQKLVARVAKTVALRRTPIAERRIATVIFNFPPNAGATGTAAYLDVFASLFNTLKAMKSAGYTVDLPTDVETLRDTVLGGNAEALGAEANVHVRIPTDDHVRRERYLKEIESQWGSAPGRQQSDGRSIMVLGAEFGNVFVGVQPAFGYEGDPMRLLFERGFAPTHAFSAFYRWLREDYEADAILHFGTHGALEFMPGHQTGLGEECWPDRLIGDTPNFYLYAANNPSEGAIAKRRSGATLISYLTPSVTQAGLYRGLLDLKGSIDRWRGLSPDAVTERERLAPVIQAQAAAVDLAAAEPAWNGDLDARVLELSREVTEFEQTLIPNGMHTVGAPPDHEERSDLLRFMAESLLGESLDARVLDALVDGQPAETALKAAGISADATTLESLRELARAARFMGEDHETAGVLHALDGGFIRPVPGGDLLRSPAILPTGRNVHGFDPYRLPSAYAMADGAAQAQRIIDRHVVDGNGVPDSIALVLWGTDNLKSEGCPIGQALALIGAKPRFDAYGRLCGAELVPLDELGRQRIDVVMTLSGIFRDLLPLQVQLLAEAAWLAATADEPIALNAVRRHALAYAESHGCDLETAALRVFSNADGAYGSNVNHLIDSGAWSEEDELAEAYSRRKCFAYGRDGKSSQQSALLQSALGDVDLAYQNLESVELGVTTLDHYFDTLGGIGRAVQRAKGDAIPVYIGDQTRGDGLVRTLGEQVELETRTRMLNPKWYEGMLKHGYEGVRQIEAHVTNTMGWSATTGQVAPWVYLQLTETFVLDPEMRERLATLNPKASARVANRLLEAHERDYWSPDEAVLDALREAGEELEDRLEGVATGVAAA